MTITPKSVRTLRLRLRLTQAELAHRLGVSPRSVLRWEKGHATPLPIARRRIEELQDAQPAPQNP